MGYKIIKKVVYEIWETPIGPFDRPLEEIRDLRLAKRMVEEYEEDDKE